MVKGILIIMGIAAVVYGYGLIGTIVAIGSMVK